MNHSLSNIKFLIKHNNNELICLINSSEAKVYQNKINLKKKMIWAILNIVKKNLKVLFKKRKFRNLHKIELKIFILYIKKIKLLSFLKKAILVKNKLTYKYH